MPLRMQSPVRLENKKQGLIDPELFCDRDHDRDKFF
jgi:hypothetical protein